MRERIVAPQHDRTRSLGFLGLAWIEHFCVHGPGDVQGVPLKGRDGLPLDDEIAGFIVDVYALGARGRRLYDTGVLSRAKGRTKSELAGFVGLLEAFGPCRFAGWAEGGERFRWRDFTYVYEPGEAMGRAVTYPFIRCLATEESQAGNTYDNIYFNLHDGPLGEGIPSNDIGLTRIYVPGGGEIVPSTASSSAKDGGKETLTVFDEPHLYITPELRRMYVTVDRNCRKRKESTPWALLTSTIYETGQDSIMERMHMRAKAIMEGRTRETRLLFDHREADAGIDLTDGDAIKDGLREAYGPFAECMDLDGIVENEFWNIVKSVEDSRRYFFNQPPSARDALLEPDEWDLLADDALRLDEGDTVALFFDGSKSDDATALVACRVDDGAVFVLGCWEKPESDGSRPDDGEDRWEVDRADVDRVVRETKEWLDVVAFYADTKEFEQYVDDWGEFFRDVLLIDATGGKYQHPVAWDMRARVADFTSAVARFLVDVKDRSFRYDGDPRMRRHALNGRRSPNKYGVSVSKEGRESPRKIDLLVCAIGARQARRDVIASGKLAKRKKRGGKLWSPTAP